MENTLSATALAVAVVVAAAALAAVVACSVRLWAGQVSFVCVNCEQEEGGPKLKG
jgi:hypothetical protein